MKKMAVESMNEKYSVKNLLFYRAIPNYVPSENIDGHNLYGCTDCGDKFILESSYQYHIQRRSVQITYKCRHCSPRIIFYNRCNLLSHIRSHTFKTATINVSDLKIDPLPISHFKSINKNETITSITTEKYKKQNNSCCECKKDITNTGPIYKDRANHFMEYTNKVYSCPVCLFTLPTSCGLKAHIRIHLKSPPFYCPECGMHMSNRSIVYPYNHSCEGFNMMRATTRNPCPIKNCTNFHPNDYKKHMKDKHLKKIFSCPACVVACYNESTMQKHISFTHEQNYEANIFFQCELCPGRLVMQSHIESHLNNHKNIKNIYPCWICSTTFKEIPDLINHHVHDHEQSEELKTCLLSLETGKKVYRVVKRCDQCLRNIAYKCFYEDIKILPVCCPFKCTPVTKSVLNSVPAGEMSVTKIKCPLCDKKVNDNWINIKKHFASNHKDHRCLDAIISLPRISNVKTFLNRRQNIRDKPTKGNDIIRTTKRNKKNPRRNNISKIENVPSAQDMDIEEKTEEGTNASYTCGKCQNEPYETKEALENHIRTEHRDPCMSYQCMECGECFVVKPSFSIHLLFHGISDVDEYINLKQCYNENALNKCVTNIVEEPLEENQCKICREKFHDSEDLEKHFRVHGMAFLMKNSINKPVTS